MRKPIKIMIYILVSIILLICLLSFILYFTTKIDFKNGEYQIYKSTTGRNKIMEVYQKALSMWKIPYNEIDINTTYGKTHIIISGLNNKRPMVLLNGGSGFAPSWIWNISDLSSKYRVYSIDIIGMPGKSSLVALPKTTKDYSDWLNEIFIKLNVEKAVIIGLSYGGFITQWFQYYFPNKVEKIVLLSYSYKDQNTELLMAFKMLYYYLIAKAHDAVAYFNAGEMKDHDIQNNIEIVFDYLRKYSFSHMIAPTNVPDSSVKNIGIPVLIIMGEKDPIWDAIQAREYCKQINNQNIHFEMIPDAGHFVPFDRANIVDKMVLDFLK